MVMVVFVVMCTLIMIVIMGMVVVTVSRDHQAGSQNRTKRIGWNRGAKRQLAELLRQLAGADKKQRTCRKS